MRFPPKLHQWSTLTSYRAADVDILSSVSSTHLSAIGFVSLLADLAELALGRCSRATLDNSGLVGDGLLTLGDIVKALTVDRLARVLLGLGRGSTLAEIILARDALLSACDGGDGAAIELSSMLGL